MAAGLKSDEEAALKGPGLQSSFSDVLLDAYIAVVENGKVQTNGEEISKMREELLQLLSTENPEIDFTASDELVDDGILDSLTIVSVIGTLSMEYGIDIPYEEIIPENFKSIDAMEAMVERLQA